MKRRVARKPARKARPRPRTLRRDAASGPDPLADARVRALFERYCRLARVKRAAAGTDLQALSLPPGERRFFRDRALVRVAFSLDALEREPAAEIALLGSPLLSQLFDAIRARATRRSLGLIAPETPPATSRTRVELTIPVRNATAPPGKARSAVHPVGRLIARVVLRAGAMVEEAVVDSDVFDLSAGAPVAGDVARLFHELEAGQRQPAAATLVERTPAVAPREPEDLLRLLLGNLREQAGDRVAARRAAAAQQLAEELARLDRYFATILAEQADPEGVAAVTALAERRRTEEIRRNQVRAIVHPLQLVEANVLIQRAEWQLETASGHHAAFSAQRSASGTGDWIFTCPHCGRVATGLVVCKHDHCACEACAQRCAVCDEEFCDAHGLARCRVDGEPACEEHGRTCPSCRLAYCTAHEGTCAEGEHAACTACLTPCASCGRVVCNRHAEQTSADAPKHSRRLCAACLRRCEGGSNEAVGVDEATQCATCERLVCTSHQAVCAVDGQIHCARHLRRADASHRLVCGRHWAACAYEGATLYASDELGRCSSCGKQVCTSHSAECAGDAERHCLAHLEPLADTSDAYACATHRKHCRVDGKAFSPTGVSECPVCGKDACAEHRARCGSCGRLVCSEDSRLLKQARELRRCSTCAQLTADAETSDAVITAALAAAGGTRKAGSAVRAARDHRHSVVELDLGLGRKTVVALRHADLVAESVVKHSLLGSKRRV